MSDRIGILGCGWLGFPLATTLLENAYEVHGSTTSKGKISVLREAGIIPYQLILSEEKIDGNISKFLGHIDILIIDIPPGLRGKNSENFVGKIKLLIHEIEKSQVRRIIFVSSTSVYGDEQGEVSEASVPEPTSESGKQLLECEHLLMNAEEFQATIIRFGGLIGPDRHPVTMLSGRENVFNGNAPVNLIHRDDCILLITTIIKNNYWGEIFNGVYPSHPSKREYYTSEAKKRGIPLPKYPQNTAPLSGKIVVGKNFKEKGHNFKTSIHA
ncbi:NAD-dependent epimerase/dehydratase family protein [Flagellimonas meishanensis]|uniref:NAD-dependent epimerase/dehydratase family protein n=1 Tax=Flagellimonas meishanensis TaxID=2873264 RepID=UPI001CA6E7D5|nr:NAD-dependent epimerase/dehydratase family protein [[Muricauda] meishanensis]